MKISRTNLYTHLLLLAILGLSTTGCFRDPDARKQRFFASGQRYFDLGKYQEATIEFQNALQIDKNFAAARHKLGQSFLHQGLLSNAYRELSIAVDLDPSNTQAQIDLASFLIRVREFKTAKEHAETILKDNPGNGEALILLANSENGLGNTEAAFEVAQRAVQMAPDKPSAYITLAVIQEALKQDAAAGQSLERAVSIDTKFVPSRLALGAFYERTKRLDDAEAQYREAIRIDPKNTLSRAALASLFVVSGKKTQAEQVLFETKAALPNDPVAYTLLADFYAASGENAKALAEFASLHDEHPKDTTVKKRYVQLLIGDKKFDQAMKLNQEILTANAKDPDALVARGEMLTLQNKPAEAIPILEAAIRGNPEEPQGYFQLGLAHEMTGNLTAARKDWGEAVKRRPWMLNAQQALAELALRNDDADLLDESAAAWLKFSPSAPDGYFYKGIALAKKGDLPGGVNYLQKAVETDPKFAAGYSRLGDVRFLQGRLRDAEKFYEQALTLNPREEHALQNLANIYIAQKQPQKALQRVQIQVNKVPNSGVYQLMLGQAFLSNNQNAAAETALAKSAELNKSDLATLILLAQVQERNGHTKEALESYENAVRLHPQDPSVYTLFGIFEEHRGDWQKAQQLYRKALDFQAAQATAANNLSYLMLEHGGDVDTALSLAQIARRGMPDSPSTADTLAWAYYKKGVYRSAISLLQEAIRKVPQNPTYYYHLGLAYQKANDLPRAKDNFQRALQLDGGSPRSQEIRQILAEISAA